MFPNLKVDNFPRRWRTVDLVRVAIPQAKNEYQNDGQPHPSPCRIRCNSCHDSGEPAPANKEGEDRKSRLKHKDLTEADHDTTSSEMLARTSLVGLSLACNRFNPVGKVLVSGPVGYISCRSIAPARSSNKSWDCGHVSHLTGSKSNITEMSDQGRHDQLIPGMHHTIEAGEAMELTRRYYALPGASFSVSLVEQHSCSSRGGGQTGIRAMNKAMGGTARVDDFRAYLCSSSASTMAFDSFD